MGKVYNRDPNSSLKLVLTSNLMMYCWWFALVKLWKRKSHNKIHIINSPLQVTTLLLPSTFSFSLFSALLSPPLDASLVCLPPTLDCLHTLQTTCSPQLDGLNNQHAASSCDNPSKVGKFGILNTSIRMDKMEALQFLWPSPWPNPFLVVQEMHV